MKSSSWFLLLIKLGLFQANPHNYDAWFDYLRLVESDAEADTVREVYERAIANVPPIQEKRHWKRYIYLWLNYALYEELEAKVRRRVGGSRECPFYPSSWLCLLCVVTDSCNL